MTTAEILDRAADLIEKVGWGPAPSLCMVQAIRACTRCGVDAVNAYEAVQRHLGLPVHRRTAGEAIILWNDRKGRTQAEVVAALRLSAVKAFKTEKEFQCD